MLTRLVLFSVKHHALVRVGFIVLGLVCLLYAISAARINSDLSTLVRPSDSLGWYQDNEYYKQQFPAFNQTALVVISGDDALVVEQTSQKLAHKLQPIFPDVFAPGIDEFVKDRRHFFLDIEQVEQWAKGIEYAYGPILRLNDEASIANFLFVLADHLSVNRGLPLPAPLEAIAKGVGDEKFPEINIAPQLIDESTQTHYQLIILKGIQDHAAQLPNEQIVQQIREAMQGMPIPLNVQVRLTGEIPLAHEEIQAALNGVGLAGLVSIVLLIFILGFGIRSAGFVAAIFTLLLVGGAITLALAIVLVGSFNTLSLIFVVMFFGLGVDFAVHFGLRIREARQTLPKSEAFSLAAKDTGPALLLCMLTSSIAFLSFAPTAYSGLGELGVISAIGMVVAFILSLTLLTALLANVEFSATQDSFNLDRFKLSVPVTLGCFFVILCGSLWFAKNAQFDYSVLAMRDSNTEGMQTLLELQEAKITTDYSISVIAENQTEASQLKATLVALDEVGSVTDVTDLVPQRQTEKRQLLRPLIDRFESIDPVVPAEDASEEQLAMALQYLSEQIEYLRPEDAELINAMTHRLSGFDQVELASRNAELYVALQKSIPNLRQVLSTPTFVLEDLPKSYRQRFLSEKGEFLLTVQPEGDLADRDATTAFIESVSSKAPNIAGRSVVEWGVGGVVVESFMQAVGTSLGCIFLILAVYFRSLVLPILVLVPVAVTLVITLAISELTGLSLNMANILVVPLIIGLGVDTGIHVVHRYMSNQKADLFRSSTARAVVISALTTIGTFFSLSFSPHLGAASIGLLLTVAISLLVVVTFVLLPVLLHVMVGNQKQI